MDNYNEPEVKGLVWNESFRNWVLAPTPQLDACWNQYLRDNPQAAPALAQARKLVLAVQVKHSPVPEGEVHRLVRDTLRTIEAGPAAADLREPPRRPGHQWWIRAAAALLVLLGAAWAVHTRLVPAPDQSAYTRLVSNTPGELVEKANRSGKPLKLRLSDGSWVTLQKDSRISYLPAFEGPVREVYLSGEAFFEVVKDPSRPFVVYANELVTKVLGTSFTVSAYDNDAQVSVEVRTGKVSVALGSEAKTKPKATHRELAGVVLTPNQKIVFSRADIRMTKLLVEQPVVTAPAGFHFEDTPAVRVFAALEKAYSVEIVYDEDLMPGCPLTASFTDESLFEKLDIICKAIEAEYEVIDGQIVIHSKGCNN